MRASETAEEQRKWYVVPTEFHHHEDRGSPRHRTSAQWFCQYADKNLDDDYSGHDDVLVTAGAAGEV